MSTWLYVQFSISFSDMHAVGSDHSFNSTLNYFGLFFRCFVSNIRCCMGICCNVFGNCGEILARNNILCYQFASDGNVSNLSATNGLVHRNNWLKYHRHFWAVHCIFGKRISINFFIKQYKQYFFLFFVDFLKILINKHQFDRNFIGLS